MHHQAGIMKSEFLPAGMTMCCSYRKESYLRVSFEALVDIQYYGLAVMCGSKETCVGCCFYSQQ